MKKTPILLGAHLSTAGGLEQAILRGNALECTAIQFFSKNNRQWSAKELSAHETTLFKKTREESNILSVTIHASYLINIGTAEPELAQKSLVGLTEEYNRACALGAEHLVFHPGSAGSNGDEIACLERIANNINLLLKACTPSRTKLVLETMAGQGSNVCYSFEQLAYILDRVEQKERVGICFDTCHVFAAGYDIAGNYKGVMEQFNRIIGLDQLSVIHLNDSKKGVGSRVDRHEHIGKGVIGLQAFRSLLNDPRLGHVPKILETPKDIDNADAMNMAVVRELISE